MSITRLRATSGAGDETREGKNERLLNDKFVDLFEQYMICLSPILDIILDKIHAYKLLIEDEETSEHHNSFLIAQNLNIYSLLPDMILILL